MIEFESARIGVGVLLAQQPLFDRTGPIAGWPNLLGPARGADGLMDVLLGDHRVHRTGRLSIRNDRSGHREVAG